MTKEVDPTILALRQQMELIEARRVSSGLVIDQARYDAETSDENHELISSFLEALPVVPMFHTSGNMDISVPDPSDLRLISAFGVFCKTSSLTGYEKSFPGLVIGERTKKDGKPERKQLLVAGWKRGARLSDTTFSDPVPCVYRLDVPSEAWDTHREQAISQLVVPHDSDVIKDLFNAQHVTYLVGQENAVDLGMATVQNPVLYSDDDIDSMSVRRKVRRLTDDDTRTIGSFEITEIPLLCSDMEEYSVMAHLETLAAAFGVGDKLDQIRTDREHDLPLHPAEVRLGLTDYPEVVARSAIHDVGSTATVQALAQ